LSNNTFYIEKNGNKLIFIKKVSIAMSTQIQLAVIREEMIKQWDVLETLRDNRFHNSLMESRYEYHHLKYINLVRELKRLHMQNQKNSK
jgi:hypothetical protein